jgi:hypothetical protein
VGDEATGLLDTRSSFWRASTTRSGSNGTRLRWRWNQRRRDLGEAGMRAEMVARSDARLLQDVPVVPRTGPPSARTLLRVRRAPLRGTRAGPHARDREPDPRGDRDDRDHPRRQHAALRGHADDPRERPRGGARRAALAPARVRRLTLVRYARATRCSRSPPRSVADRDAGVPPRGISHFAFNSMALVQLGPLSRRSTAPSASRRSTSSVGSRGAPRASTSPQPHRGRFGGDLRPARAPAVHGYRTGGAYGTRLRSAMAQNILIMGS